MGHFPPLAVSLCSMLLCTYTLLSRSSELFSLTFTETLDLTGTFCQSAQLGARGLLSLFVHSAPRLSECRAEQLLFAGRAMVIVSRRLGFVYSLKINDWFSVGGCLSSGLLLVFVKCPPPSLCTLNRWALLSQCDRKPGRPCRGAALNCSRIALMLVRNWICCFCLFVCFRLVPLKRGGHFWSTVIQFFFFFSPLWCRIEITSHVCWWQWMDKPVFPSCVYVLGDQRMCMIVDVANKQNKTCTLVEAIPFVSADNKGMLGSEMRRWRWMMPLAAAVIYKATESRPLIDVSYLRGTSTQWISSQPDLGNEMPPSP